MAGIIAKSIRYNHSASISELILHSGNLPWNSSECSGPALINGPILSPRILAGRWVFLENQIAYRYKYRKCAILESDQKVG